MAERYDNRCIFLPLINYDGAEYGKQLKENKDNSFSGLYHPVVTIVLYFGEKPWNYSTELLDCLDVPKELVPYVSNYHINLFDMNHVSAEDSVKFKSDFRHIVEFYAALNSETEYEPSDETLDHAREIADFFRVFQNDERFITAYNEATKNKEEISMCKYVDRLEARGEAKGREKGRAEGEAKGRAEGEAKGRAEGEAIGREEGRAEGEARGILITLADLVRKGLITVSQAAEQAKMTVEEFKEKAGFTAA